MARILTVDVLRTCDRLPKFPHHCLRAFRLHCSMAQCGIGPLPSRPQDLHRNSVSGGDRRDYNASTRKSTPDLSHEQEVAASGEKFHERGHG